jgi:hypothetical protein
MDENPRRELIVSTLLRFGLTVFLCALPFIKFGVKPEAAGMSLLIFFPCSFMLSKPIMEWAEVLGVFVRRRPLAKWQGSYYQFAGIHIRIYPIEKSLWFVDSDVLRVIEKKSSPMLRSRFDVNEYELIPGTKLHGFSEQGIEKLLRASPHPEAGRMLLWVQRDVVKPFRRRLEMEADRLRLPCA